MTDIEILEARITALEARVDTALRLLNIAVRANTKTLEILVKDKEAFRDSIERIEHPGLLRRIFG